jgi:hypothetical protein
MLVWEKKEATLERAVGVDGRIILKWILREKVNYLKSILSHNKWIYEKDNKFFIHFSTKPH